VFENGGRGGADELVVIVGYKADQIVDLTETTGVIRTDETRCVSWIVEKPDNPVDAIHNRVVRASGGCFSRLCVVPAIG